MKDSHTEHCCIVHGCKYGEETIGCTVYDGFHIQSFPCELCFDEDPTITAIILEKTFNNLKEQRKENYRNNPENASFDDDWG